MGLCDWESHNVRACCVENTELEAKTENHSGRVRGLAGETGERSQTQTQDTDRYIEYITETATDVNRVSNLESV